MQVNPCLDHKFVTLRSGHKSYSNDRHYTADTTAGTLPGGKVLSGWNNPYLKATVPNLFVLETIVPKTVLEYFMSNIFTISLADCQNGGKLPSLLAISTASLLRYFSDVNRDLDTQNPITINLTVALQKTKHVEE